LFPLIATRSAKIGHQSYGKDVWQFLTISPGLEIIVPDESLTQRGLVRDEVEAAKVIKLV